MQRHFFSVHLFGAFRVWRAGEAEPIANWARRKTQALFKILVSQRGRVFTSDELIELLFPGRDPDKALQNLQGRVSELRKVLEPSLSNSPASALIKTVGKSSYVFIRSSACLVDIEQFAERADQASHLIGQGAWAAALERCQMALEQYAEYLPEDRYEEWSLNTRMELHARFLKLLHDFAICNMALQRSGPAIE